MKLALGISSFGKHMLNSTKYLNTITDFDTCVITDEFLPNKYTMPTFLTDKYGHLIQTFDSLFHTLDFELIVSNYTQCVVFIGIGGDYSTTVFQKLLDNCSVEIRKKLFVIAIQPFNFEWKSKQRCAEKMKKLFQRLDINYQIFCNQNLIDDQISQDINTSMDLFYKMLFDAIPNAKDSL